jgi:hypothetical protein
LQNHDVSERVAFVSRSKRVSGVTFRGFVSCLLFSDHCCLILTEFFDRRPFEGANVLSRPFDNARVPGLRATDGWSDHPPPHRGRLDRRPPQITDVWSREM